MDENDTEIPIPENVALFRREVYDRRDEIDPTCREDRFTLALGWAIAKGMQPREARDFAIYIRYQSYMG
jgi:hypothetical protein|nr:hypothetical protein [Neorhizobium tomejilense]